LSLHPSFLKIGFAALLKVTQNNIN
jgi:hypothetical protein